jgi:lysozyme
MRKINQLGIELIKKWEGLKLKSYKDIVGVWTVGYGHTGLDVLPNMTITAQQAEDLLKKDLERFERYVNNLQGSTMLNDNEFAALVSLAFNVGSFGPGLRTAIASNDKPGIASKILLYNKADGKVIQGLVNRRKAEVDLFKTPINSTTQKKKGFKFAFLFPFVIFGLSKT